jgi:hypothetical protein
MKKIPEQLLVLIRKNAPATVVKKLADKDIIDLMSFAFNYGLTIRIAPAVELKLVEDYAFEIATYKKI